MASRQPNQFVESNQTITSSIIYRNHIKEAQDNLKQQYLKNLNDIQIQADENIENNKPKNSYVEYNNNKDSEFKNQKPTSEHNPNLKSELPQQYLQTNIPQENFDQYQIDGSQPQIQFLKSYIHSDILNENERIQEPQNQLSIQESKQFQNENESSYVKKPRQSSRLSQFYSQVITICPFCQNNYQIDDMDQHLFQCSEKPIKCSYCQDEYPQMLFAEHLDQCEIKQYTELEIQRIQQQPSERIFQGQQQTPFNPSVQRNSNTEQSGSLPSVAMSQDENHSRLVSQISDLQLSDEEERLPEFLYQSRPNLSPSAQYCSICQQNYKNNQKLTLLFCLHKYHSKCIKEWLALNEICPICRRNAYQQGDFDNQNQSVDDDDNNVFDDDPFRLE